MNNRRTVARLLAAVAAAAACALALDAAVALAAAPSTTRPTTAPVVAATPTTGPALIDGSVSSTYARPGGHAPAVPTLHGAPNGASIADLKPTVTIGGGVNPGQPAPAPPAADSSFAAPPATQPSR